MEQRAALEPRWRAELTLLCIRWDGTGQGAVRGPITLVPGIWQVRGPSATINSADCKGNA